MSPPAPPLPALAAIKLWTAAVAFERRLQAEISPLGLTVPGFRLVGELMGAPEGLRQGVLAARLGVRPPTVSAAVARLEAQGLVARTRDPNDPRARRVHLVPGTSLSEGVDVLLRLEAALTSGLSEPDRARLLATLDDLTQRLTGAPQEADDA